MPDPRVCRRCDRPVVASAADYEVFEQMHYVCFHYEFEHEGDPDVECPSGGCPASGLALPSRLIRTDRATSKLERAYAEAWQEWEDSGDAEAWAATATDRR